MICSFCLFVYLIYSFTLEPLASSITFSGALMAYRGVIITMAGRQFQTMVMVKITVRYSHYTVLWLHAKKGDTLPRLRANA